MVIFSYIQTILHYPDGGAYTVAKDNLGKYPSLLAGGCTALTGIEAISNGVGAFQPPESKNAAKTMVSMGIIVLTIVSSIIVVVFQANEIAMLPLYALGVMLSFTLSQAGMSRLMGKVGKLKPGESGVTDVTKIHYERSWRWKKALNMVGAIMTGIVFVILTATKFLDGAWMVAFAIPLLVFTFDRVNKRYQK